MHKMCSAEDRATTSGGVGAASLQQGSQVNCLLLICKMQIIVISNYDQHMNRTQTYSR